MPAGRTEEGAPRLEGATIAVGRARGGRRAGAEVAGKRTFPSLWGCSLFLDRPHFFPGRWGLN